MKQYVGKATKSGVSQKIVRGWRKFLVTIQESGFVSSSFRIKLLRLAGVKIGERNFIGTHITFDTMHPEYISIGHHVKITSGTKILTHFFNPADQGMYLGKVTIQDEAFLGLNTLIVAPVTIGEGAVCAAGSVVVCDIPAWEIWGGNPAKFIKKRVVK